MDSLRALLGRLRPSCKRSVRSNFHPSTPASDWQFNRYCPPKLVELGAIWTFFSITSNHMLDAFRSVYSDTVLILEQDLSLEEVSRYRTIIPKLKLDGNCILAFTKLLLVAPGLRMVLGVPRPKFLTFSLSRKLHISLPTYTHEGRIRLARSGLIRLRNTDNNL